jgi:hypothetical protein
MAALVEAEPNEPRRIPGAVRALPDCPGIEGDSFGSTEHERVVRCAARSLCLPLEVGPERFRQRDDSSPSSRLGQHRSGLDIPRAFDPDQASLEVDVAPSKSHQLAASQSREERGRPERAILWTESGEQGVRIRW